MGTDRPRPGYGTNLQRHRYVQDIARHVLAQLTGFMRTSATEASIAAAARDLLAAEGVTRAWYHDVPALVLAGSRSCISISGRNYVPAEDPFGEHNLVTVDLSPELDGYWGDCARSFPMQDGAYTTAPRDPALARGLATIDEFHRDVLAFVTAATTFHELHAFAAAWLDARGYECLDFLGNFGHSISRTLADRVYIESGNHQRLIDVALFTFEPHIRSKAGPATPAGCWGFKHENIYHFNDRGRLEEL